MAMSPATGAAATSGGWSNLGRGATATTAALNERVIGLTRVSSTLYVGGYFTKAGGVTGADYVAKWSGTAWSKVGAGLNLGSGNVNAIAVDGTKVYVAGSFSNAGGDLNADNLAVWNGSTWHAVAGVSISSPVLAMTIVGRTLFIGGGFSNVNSIAEADGVAAYGLDSGTWSAITDDSGDMGGTVWALAPDGAGGLYVGGYFVDVNGIATADYVAHWTGGTSWAALGSDGAGQGAINGIVRGLAVSGSTVYAVGDFINAGLVGAADRVATFSGSTWSSLGATSFFGDVGNLSIYDVALDGPRVFVVGSFINAGGLAKVDGVAAFVNGVWTNVGTDAAGTSGPASSLRTVEVVGPRLYVSGLDTSIGGGSLNVCAAYYRLRQPDGQIATTAAFIGNNVYNATGASQTKSLTVHRNNSGTFKIKVANDGFATENFTLKGPGSGGGFTATYKNGTTNVTAAVVAGTFAINGLAPGASRTITLTVRVGSGVSVGATRSWLVTSTSTGQGTPKDSVKATVKAS
jgi:hypothetical protein